MRKEGVYIRWGMQHLCLSVFNYHQVHRKFVLERHHVVLQRLHHHRPARGPSSRPRRCHQLCNRRRDIPRVISHSMIPIALIHSTHHIKIHRLLPRLLPQDDPAPMARLQPHHDHHRQESHVQRRHESRSRRQGRGWRKDQGYLVAGQFMSFASRMDWKLTKHSGRTSKAQLWCGCTNAQARTRAAMVAGRSGSR